MNKTTRLRGGAVRTARVGVASALSAAALVGGTQIVVGSLAVARTTTMTTTTTVNVRSGPGTSYRVIDVAHSGSTVVATGPSSSGWTPVLWQGRAAFISSAYLATSRTAATVRPSARTRAASTAVTTVALNVRTGPSTSTQVVRVLDPGTAVPLTGTSSDGWLQVIVDGRTLWVSGRYVRTGSAPAPTKTTLPPVTGRARATTALMIRTQPGPVFDSLGDIPEGTVLDLTGKESQGTTQVVWEGALRWVNSRFLVAVSGSAPGATPAPLPAVVGQRYATTALNIRSTSTGDGTLYEVSAGTRLAITGTYANGRAQVIVQGAVRWVTAAYLSTTPPPSAIAPSTPISRDAVGGRPDLGATTGGSSGLTGLVSNARDVVLAVRSDFPAIRTIYGTRPDPLPDHPSGHAVDLMLPNGGADADYGWQVARYLQAHAQELGISYVIYHQHIWSVARSGEGWRAMADRGGATANHMDHVHVTVY